MDDLISRAAALDAIDGMKPMKDNTEQLFMQALCWVAVKTVPNVDAVPVVYGRWVKPERSLWPVADCSVCGEMCIVANTANYCPNCGAKMINEE